MNTCAYEDCSNKVRSRGLCLKHWREEKVAGTLENWPRRYGKWFNPDGSRMKCSLDFCENVVKSRGWCAPHYAQHERGADFTKILPDTVCPVEGCGRPMRPSSQVCKRCNQFGWRYGLSPDQVKELNLSRICGNPGCRSTENLHFDHDHSCCPLGAFPQSTRVSCGKCGRGWLCASCNKALGMLQENPRRIEGLLEYLTGF